MNNVFIQLLWYSHLMNLMIVKAVSDMKEGVLYYYSNKERAGIQVIYYST